MLISCPICMLAFDQSSDIFCLPCGHLYHVACTMQWFERTQTCPQCRKPTTERKCIKVYPQVANLDSQCQSPSNMIDTIDNLKLDITNIRKERNAIESEKKTLEKEVTVLKESQAVTTSELVRLESHNSLMKKQIKSLKNIEIELKDMKNRKEKAEKELAIFKNVNKVLNGSLSEAQEALMESAGTTDVSSILTMCNSLKRELLHVKAQKQHLKRTLDHEKARFKGSYSKLEEEQKKEVDKLNMQINELEQEILLLSRANRRAQKMEQFNDLGVGVLDVDRMSQASSASSTSNASVPSSSQSSTHSKHSTGSSHLAMSSKSRVLKPSNTNKVKLALQKNSIFSTARPGSSGTTGLLKRMYDNAANPPVGMAYDGMGRTVKAETGFKTSRPISGVKKLRP